MIRPIVSIKTASIWQVPEFGALKGFSDSIANLENHWETSQEEVTRRIAKWFGGQIWESRDHATGKRQSLMRPKQGDN